MSEEERRQLQQQLWNIANTLRGKMGADEFRDYILGFIFYKYLSEKIQRFADIELKQENLNFVDIDENSQDGKKYIAALSKAALSELGYFLKPSELFHAIAMKGSNQKDSNNEGESHNFILDDLTKILKNIEQSTLGTDSADDFVNLFEDLDLTSSKLGKSEKEKNDLVAKVLVHLDKIDFDLSNKTGDVLGDAYEYLIGEFASGAGKKAGEFYTPQPASSLLAKLVTAINKNIKSAYDPTCGSGSLLLRVKREANKVGKIYGQELNRTTYNLARMNMILHDVHFADFDIRQEDTLEHPQHRELKFDVIVANPPFSAQWSASQLHMSDDRFSAYGKLAPSSKADMAFVQHMIYHLDEEGTMAVLLPHGVLFRGGAEGHIRQYLIEQMNCLDAVIGLPANMFYGTSIPTCVLVFKKCRKNPDDILFIDASQHFEKVKTSNVMRPEHIDKIVEAYKTRTNEAKYSYVASMDEVKANDYNLNIPRYVDTFEADDAINLDVVTNNLTLFDEQSKVADGIIAKFCEELNIPKPKGNNIFWLTQYKKGVIQQIFSQQLRFRNNDGLNYPEWEESEVGDIFKVTRGNVLSMSLVAQTQSNENPYPVFSSQTKNNGLAGYFNTYLYENSITWTTDGANAGDVNYREGKFYCTNVCGVLINDKGYANSCTAEMINAVSKKYVSYVGNPKLMNNIMAKIIIDFPCVDEQTKISNFLTAINDKIASVQAQLAAM